MTPWQWLLAAAGLLATAIAAPADSLVSDPAARFGALENGVRYVVVATPTSGSHTALRLLVDAGSRQERDDERGLAHFLEHMAFNGSRHYPPGTLVERLQRMGMSFGPDANADTDFDRTLYLLDLPDPSTGLAEGFQILADDAGGLLLRPEMIEKERGIILSERRARDTPRHRLNEARRAFCLPDTLFPRRRPIGLDDVVREVKRDKFVSFYDTWYRPERMTVIAVGEIDAATAVREITAAFSGLRDRAPARPDPSLGRLPSSPGLHVAFVSVPEEPGPTVSVSAFSPLPSGPDSGERRRQALRLELAVAMFNRRLEILSRREDAPFGSGRMQVRDHSRFYREARIEFGTKREYGKEGLAAAEQELRRALTYGFGPEEFREAVAAKRLDLVQSAENAGHRPAKEIADGLVRSLLRREVFLSPGQTLALLGPELDRTTSEDCTDALRQAWSPPHRFVLVSGKTDFGSDPVKAITAAYRKSETAAIGPPRPASTPPWAYTSFGRPGTVVRRAFLRDLGLTLVTFGNGVRLNIKPTRFSTDRIEVEVAFGTGERGEPHGKAGLGYFASQAFIAGGLGRLTVDDLQRLFAGKSVGAEFVVSDDEFGFHGATDRENLTQELQLIAAEFTDPGYRPEAGRNAHTLIASQYYSLVRTPDGPFEAIVPRLLADGDVRIGLPPSRPVLSRTMKETEAWLAPQLHHGPIEATVVGDCDLEKTIAAVAATLGALPAREAKAPSQKLSRIAFPPRPFRRDYTIPTQIPTAVVALYWPTTDGTDLHRTDSLRLLARVLQDRLRLKLREQLGDTYTPFAFSITSESYPGYGYLETRAGVDPAKADAVANVMAILAANLKAQGVQPDELDRARQPLLADLREVMATNKYWLAVLNRAQGNPTTLERARRELADLASVDPEDLDALATSYLAEDKSFRVIVRPALKPERTDAD